MESDLSGYAEAIATALLGPPNRSLSSPTNLRYGTHGSLWVDLEKNGWFDHERNIGGNMVELVQDKLGLDCGEALRWIRDRGLAPDRAPAKSPRPRIAATYEYRDETGHPLFEVVRMVPKSFRQRRPDGRGGWDWSTKGTRKVLYRLSELIAADPDQPVFLVEGQKDADRLTSLGLVATTSPGGANKWRSEFAKFLIGRRVIVLPDNDEAGRAHAETVARDLKGTARAVAILKLDALPEKGDVSDWIDAGGTKDRLLDLAEREFAGVGTTPTPEPMPLVRPRGAAQAIPREALGPLLPAVEAIETITQAPPALAMQSVLACASLVTQAFADVETLGGPAPIGLFQLSIAESGERKSACDRLATRAVREFEREQVSNFPILKARYQDRSALHEANRAAIIKQADGNADRAMNALDDLGPAPQPPLAPNMLFSDPTIEGVLRHFEDGQPSVGVFSDEGGQMFGGHAMNSDNRLKTGAAFSKLWDGASVNRARASASATTYYGRRVSFHVMLQPRIAEAVLADPVLRDQGLPSRTLIVMPDSRIGYRMIPEDASDLQQSEGVRNAQKSLVAYDRRVRELLETPRPHRHGDPRELDPRLLSLSPIARAALIAFANSVELGQRRGGPLESIRGFSSKAAEQAARIAGVFTIYEDADAASVDLSAVQNAIVLMTWYLNEAKRLLDSGKVPDDLLHAERLRTWLGDHWGDEPIDVRSVVRRGPGSIRDTQRVRQLFKILEEHGWLVPLSNGPLIEGKPVRQAWRIVRL